MRIQKTILFSAILCILCCPGLAQAKALISVWPMKIFLYPDQKTGEVNLINKGEFEVNAQVYAKTWDVDENGKFVETETGDFVFYPRLLTIKPGEEKKLRIAYDGPFPALEKSFRLYIYELPEIEKPEKQAEKLALGFIPLLRLSLPLFVSPSKTPPPPQAVAEEVGITEKGLKVAVRNPGNHHITLQRVFVRLTGQNQTLIAEGEAKPHILRILPQRMVWVDIPLEKSPDPSKIMDSEVSLSLEDLKEEVKQTVPFRQNQAAENAPAKEQSEKQTPKQTPKKN